MIYSYNLTGTCLFRQEPHQLVWFVFLIVFSDTVLTGRGRWMSVCTLQQQDDDARVCRCKCKCAVSWKWKRPKGVVFWVVYSYSTKTAQRVKKEKDKEKWKQDGSCTQICWSGISALPPIPGLAGRNPQGRSGLSGWHRRILLCKSSG